MQPLFAAVSPAHCEGSRLGRCTEGTEAFASSWTRESGREVFLNYRYE